MKQSEVNRFNKLYQQHLRSLKLQGKAQKTIDAYSRAVRRTGNGDVYDFILYIEDSIEADHAMESENRCARRAEPCDYQGDRMQENFSIRLRPKEFYKSTL